jgi:type IV pilus secretin PilQ/predicted competence protein
MACKKTAIAIGALMLAAAFGCATGKHGGDVHPTSDAASQAASPKSAPSSAKVTARVQEASFSEDSDGARLVLSSDSPLVYTAYEPRPDLLVVELPGASLSESFSAPAASGSLVTSVRVEPMVEMGKQLTRLSIAHREGLHYDVRTVGQGLAIALDVSSATALTDTTAAAEVAVGAAPATPAATPAPVATSQAATAVPARGEIAHVLEEVRVASEAESVTVSLLGDGLFQPREFVLDNPPRVVVDLPGIHNEVKRRTVTVKSSLVSRVRISQFQTAPEPVTRVVLDLNRPLPHVVQADGERLAVVVGTSLPAATIASAGPAPSRTSISPAPEAAAAHEPPAPAKKEPSPVDVAVAQEPPATAPAMTAAPAPQAAAAPATAPQSVSAVKAEAVTAPAAPPEISEKKTAEPPATAVPAATTPTQAASAAPAKSEAPTKLPPGVRSAHKNVSTPSAPPKATAREEALFEAAAAVLAQEDAAHPAQEAPGRFQPRTIAEAQTQFTGEPISLDLKDADIKDVFRTISQLTQLNIVVDPEVRGTVTVQLENVPWDQALDLILKQNGLGYVLENNIMRIATTAKLQAEQSDRARLAEARQAAEPTRTVIKKLSYARASEITGAIKSVMSKRGDIVVDARTNTLIIREIPTYLPAVLQLIENLDTATPQVMIEARIVETTKTLGRSLGINWGMNGVADVAHGNTTGLTFPSTIDFRGNTPPGLQRGFRVGLDAGPPVLGASFANILNTFSLDFAITAAENQGLLKIISSPKVAALTNTQASIQSGTQIPVQTNVNNTTTVIYVDATLRLQVTPQITNEGTILLDVNVQKREPAVALNLALGQNVPLTVRQYTGQILVRDGGTAVIGGIFQINDQDQNNMIPGVWKIPIFGNLFKNNTRTEKHDELLIFITPRIIRS